MEDIKKELFSFWHKFGKLLKAGIPLLRTLEVIEKETLGKRLKEIIAEIKTMIASGKNMSESIAKYPEYFSPSVQELVKIGELTGGLDTYSLKIAEGLEDGTFNVGEKLVHGEAKPLEKKEAEEAEKAPVIKLVNFIITDALKKRASDIHLEWVRDKIRIRYRIDGVLKEISPPPKEVAKALISRIKIMANMDVAEKRLPQDGRIRVNIEGKELDLRITTIPYITGESAVIRILDKASMVLSLEEQGFSKQNLETMRKWSKKPNGTVIVTGPTGCGRTTTLYALLQELNSEEVKITTVEDPVEYQIDGINQMQIRPHLGLTFARAMRSQLRQDPDIMMVGEIRDLDTAHLVTQAALTGHLVFTTLHTQDAPGAIRRLLDMGIEPFLINSSLAGVLSQRLVRIICQNCKEEYKPEEWVRELSKGYRDMKFFRGRGCERCHKTGYRGRTAIHELLEVDDKMKALIVQDADLERLRRQAIESGMVTLREDGIAKVKQGITTIEEVLRVIS